MGPRWLFLVVAAHLVLLLQVSEERSDKSSIIYKAAVVEYSAPLGITLDTKESYYQRNVETFACIAQHAAELDCDIIVFPEQGLHSIDMPKLEDGSPAILTRIPAPEEKFNPCSNNQSDIYKDLKELSCAARDNSIYVVVNVPEMVPCSSLQNQCPCSNHTHCPGEQRPCPRSGYFIYNTNVVFDREGTVIARYRKYHLHGEFPMVQTAEPEYSVFDTDFGVRFGMFISFDISFRDPATKLVTELGAHDIVSSTAWLSEMPFQTASQYQAAWSHAMDVNFLASGYNYPEYGTGGSGIYAGRMGTLVAVVPQVRSNYLLVSTIIKKHADCFDHFFKLLPKGMVIPLPSEAGEEPAPPYEYDRDYPVGLPAVEVKSPSNAAPREFASFMDQPLREIITIKESYRGTNREYLEDLGSSPFSEEQDQTENDVEEESQKYEPEVAEKRGSSKSAETDSNSDEELGPGRNDVNEDDEDHEKVTSESGELSPPAEEEVSEELVLGSYPEDESQYDPEEGESKKSPEGGESKYSPEEGESESSSEEGESESSPEESESEHSTKEGESEHSTKEGESEHSTKEGESEHSTKEGESEHSTKEGESEQSLKEGESDHVGEVLQEFGVPDEPSDVENILPHPCIKESHMTHRAEKWLPSYVYPKNAIGSGLHINRERLENFQTFLLTSENMKENSTVRVCHGVFCCEFDVILYSGINRYDDGSSPHYQYRLVAFDGVRTMNEFGEGRYQVCGVIPCTDGSLNSCGHVIKDPNVDVNYTRFHKLHIRGTFKSNNTIVGANTLAHNLLPLPASKFDYVSQSISEDELYVKMESTVSELTFLTFGIYARNYDVDDFRINKIVCEV